MLARPANLIRCSPSQALAHSRQNMGMDREADVWRLGIAERHITEAETHITGQLIALDRLQADGLDTEQAEQLLRLTQETLATYQEHRRIILAMIEQIDAGVA